MKNLGLNRILWLITALLSLVAALVGVFSPDIYSKLVTPELMPGAFSQDLITVGAAVILLGLALRIRQTDTMKQLVVLGLLGYLFYAYGIFVIERAYNWLYLVYMAVFALSFWAMIYGIASIRGIRERVSLPQIPRNVSVGFCIFTAVMFTFLWVSQLIPLMQTGNQIDALYSIYILDLCFVMPAFAILAIMTIRKNGLALLLIPALFILGFTLIFSLAVGEMVKPFYDLSINVAGLAQSLALSLVFLALAFWHMRTLRVDVTTSARDNHAAASVITFR